MRITDFKTAVHKLESEMIICLLVASTYENGYWKHYHATSYRVVAITPNQINLQMCNHKDTWHDLGEKNMKDGQFIIEY